MGRPTRDAVVRVFNTDFFWKVITRHDTGLGEAYMDGDFEVRPCPFLRKYVQVICISSSNCSMCKTFTSNITRYKTHMEREESA